MAVRRDIPRRLRRSQSRGLDAEANRILRSLRAQQRAVVQAFLDAEPTSFAALRATDRAIRRDPEVRRAIAQLWLSGSATVISELDGILGIPPDPPPDEVVVRRTRRFAGRRVTMVNEATRRAVRESISTGFDFGLTQEEIARGTGMRAAQLRETGWRPLRNIVAQTYKGRADTIARTERALVFARTSLERYALYGITHAVALDGADCGLRSHDSTPKVNGKRYALATAMRWPISHPNCIRRWAPDVLDD